MFTIEHLILNAIAQLAYNLLILLKGVERVDPFQGTRMYSLGFVSEWKKFNRGNVNPYSRRE